MTLPQLLLRLLKLRVLEGYDPAEALFQGVVDPNLSAEVREGCVSKRRFVQLQNRHNPPDLWRLTEDKGVFYRLCIERKVPIPQLLGVLDEKDGWTPNGAPLRTEDDWVRLLREHATRDFVIKPSFGAYGLGVRLFSPIDGLFRDPTGKTWTAVEIFRELRSDRKFDRFVIQSRVENHPLITKISGSRYLQTVRLATYIDLEGNVEAYFSFLKVIVGNNFIDNLMSGKTGNIFCAVDVEKGTLYPAVGRRADGMGSLEIERHPATGVTFKGTQLPYWVDALAAAKHAQRNFLPHHTIGWDIAITPDGPIIVEGNIWWDPDDILNINYTNQQPRSMITLLRRLRAEAPPKAKEGREPTLIANLKVIARCCRSRRCRATWR